MQYTKNMYLGEIPISNPLHFPDYVKSFDPSFSQSADGCDDGFTWILTFLVTNIFLCNQLLHQVKILVH